MGFCKAEVCDQRVPIALKLSFVYFSTTMALKPSRTGYVVNILFQELGVKPLVHGIDHDPEGREMEKALLRLGCNAPVPAVFIGGS
ncbi:hypothetical protein ACSQ67_019841 [Phaseolus vulgaris]